MLSLDVVVVGAELGLQDLFGLFEDGGSVGYDEVFEVEGDYGLNGGGEGGLVFDHGSVEAAHGWTGADRRDGLHAEAGPGAARGGEVEDEVGDDEGFGRDVVEGERVCFGHSFDGEDADFSFPLGLHGEASGGDFAGGVESFCGEVGEIGKGCHAFCGEGVVEVCNVDEPARCAEFFDGCYVVRLEGGCRVDDEVSGLETNDGDVAPDFHPHDGEGIGLEPDAVCDVFKIHCQNFLPK